jgi:hypothetical protein
VPGQEPAGIEGHAANGRDRMSSRAGGEERQGDRERDSGKAREDGC